MSTRSRAPLVVLLVITAAVCVRLGFWQKARMEQRRAENAAAARAEALPPVSLNAPGAGLDTTRRHATAEGTYDRTHEVVVRGHAHDQAPGVLVATPLRLAGRGDTAVLVLRGFVRAPDAVHADLAGLDEPGPVRVDGVTRALITAEDGGQPVTRDGATTWRRIDLAGVRKATPYPLLGVLLHQLPSAALPAKPLRLPVEPPGEGPHRNYMLQWFAFALTALVFAGIVATRGTGRRNDDPVVPD